MAATTRFVLTPYGAEFPSVNFPQLAVASSGSGRPYLGYDASTPETALWTMVAPQGITSGYLATVHAYMASATSGSVAFACAVEAVTNGDATQIGSSTSFDTTNFGAAVPVPGVAGYKFEIPITLTNVDSMEAGDYVRLAITRNATNTADTATGDCNVLSVEVRDGS